MKAKLAGGHTIYLERLDGTFGASSDVSIGKARTAANFMRATGGEDGRTLYLCARSALYRIDLLIPGIRP